MSKVKYVRVNWKLCLNYLTNLPAVAWKLWRNICWFVIYEWNKQTASYTQDFRLFCLSTSLKTVQWRLNRLCWPTFSPFSAYVIFCAFQTQVTSTGRQWCHQTGQTNHFHKRLWLLPLISCFFTDHYCYMWTIHSWTTQLILQCRGCLSYLSIWPIFL